MLHFPLQCTHAELTSPHKLCSLSHKKDKTFSSKVMALRYMSGQFQTPPDCELFSAVYLVYSPHKFTKPLTVEIQQCAILSSDKQCAQFALVSTKCTIKNFFTCSDCEMEFTLQCTL